MQQSQIYNDVLTGLNNRRLADEYLLEQLSECSEEKPVYFLLGDADNFKSINDVYGHVEGDHALKLLAEGLKTGTRGMRCHVARWGGDEFAIVIGAESDADPKKLIESVDAELERITAREILPYALHLSFGYVKCTSPDTPLSVLVNEADAHMYHAKAAFNAQG